MRVFVTGASGWIGSAVVPELLGAGHAVVGLARSDASADALRAAGAEVVRGSLDDLGVLRDAAAASDGVIHLAFKHEQAFAGDFPAATAADRAAIDALGSALEGSDRPLVIASGLAGVKPGAVATEDDEATGGTDRARSERAVLALAGSGVRSVSVRLAPTTHGEGDNGVKTFIVGAAREHGVAAYIGDGATHWTAVHRADAARLFRLALEHAPAGTVLHAAAERGVRQREIAEAIGRGLDLPVTSVAPDDAAAHFGWLGAFLSMDIQASSERTRALLGWDPTGPTLLADLDAGRYFSDSDTPSRRSQ
jgi:nucleoside-diphosphate-sugar epimerase